VDFLLWVLVFADADCAGLPLVKTERVGDEVFCAAGEDGFADCHVHVGVVDFKRN